MAKNKVVIGALVGAVAGFVAGLLTAPKSGKETRADIDAKTREVARSTQSAIKQQTDRGKSAFQSIRDKFTRE